MEQADSDGNGGLEERYPNMTSVHRKTRAPISRVNRSSAAQSLRLESSKSQGERIKQQLRKGVDSRAKRKDMT